MYALSPEVARYADASDRRFQRVLFALFIPFLIIALVMPFLRIPGLSEGGGQQGEEPRYAQLIRERAAEIAQQEEEPKPVEQPEPEPEPEPTPEPETQEAPEPTPEPESRETPEPREQAPQPDARQEVRQRYSSEFEALSDLRDQTLTQRMDGNRSLRSSSDVLRAQGSGVSGGGAVEQSARQRSGGGGSGEVRAAQSSTGIGSRSTTQVERPAGVGAPSPRVGDSGDQRKSGRSLDELQLVFDRNKGAFYTLYNRALREDPSLQGKVTLRITIAPNGSVTDVRIVDSQLNNPSLEQRILTRVRTLNFGAKPNVDTVTLNYPMYFMPS
ncbi:TonB family protein [Algiphilus sp.]|uniref:AgmX/PglI C-terminal domain-containing protein n=1 Tax=Algiphilus sp. TaxID=1872431 RepID=UPI003B521590